MALAATKLAADIGTAGTARIRWVTDTGSGNHLCGEARLPKGVERMVQHEDALQLATANGAVSTKGVVDFGLPGLGIEARVLLLDECPPVPSVGR